MEMVAPELSEVVLKIKEENGKDQQGEMGDWAVSHAFFEAYLAVDYFMWEKHVLEVSN